VPVSISAVFVEAVEKLERTLPEMLFAKVPDTMIPLICAAVPVAANNNWSRVLLLMIEGDEENIPV
jgi:hypothetical protein